MTTVIASQDDPLRNELVGLHRGNTANYISFFGDHRSAFEQGDPDWYEHETMRVGASLHGCALAAARWGGVTAPVARRLVRHARVPANAQHLTTQKRPGEAFHASHDAE
ncbi:hypothetical protein GCM10009627_17930 [Curtobacterium herbarum]|uniref:Uncharacterized protein n=1 Tax=Curtobacterium herbarum TaxID=150122 RepID=A0ABN1ZCW1_9MICO